MTLWNIIRDFFVMYLFGGHNSSGEFIGGNFLGSVTSVPSGADGSFGGPTSTTEFWLHLPNTFDEINGSFAGNDIVFITMADYLSTTATIIVMVLLCFLLVKLAIWIFKLGANLIRLR